MNLDPRLPVNNTGEPRRDGHHADATFAHMREQMSPSFCLRTRPRHGCIHRALELEDFIRVIEGEMIAASLTRAPYTTADSDFDKTAGRSAECIVSCGDAIVQMSLRVSESGDDGTYDSFDFSIAAPSKDLIREIEQLLWTEAAKHRFIAPPDKARLHAWHVGNHGPEARTMIIEAPTLSEAVANYPGPVGESFERLIEECREHRTGVHVWYGPPGTGKTTALRTFTQELKDIVDVHLIIDPEQLLKGGASYMMKLMQYCANKDRSYLIALEDAGQLITIDAGQRHSEALARVLNLVDGVLGQNARINLLITTNEDIGKLHPALLRPGRCGSQMDFRPFTRDEAKAWLAKRPEEHAQAAVERLTEREYTLADLFSIVEQREVVRTTSEKQPIGFRAA